jgi:outer membrane protein TolC
MIKKISRWSIVLLTCCLLSQTSAKKIAPSPLPLKMSVNLLTLNRAVALAYKHRPNLEGLKSAIQASKWEAKEALSGCLPHFSLSHQIIQSTDDKSPHSNTTFNARQLVYKFGGPLDLYNVGRKQTQVVEFLSDGEKYKVRHEVELAFLDAWLLQQQQEFIRSLQNSTKEVFKKAEHQHTVQLLDKKDWLKSSADYAQDIATIGSYDHDTVIAEKTLEFLMGQRIRVLVNAARSESETAPENLPITHLDWNAEEAINCLPIEHYYQQALKNRPDLQANKKQIEIEHERAAITRKSNLPSLELFGQVAHVYQRPTSPFNDVRSFSGFHSFGAVVNWNIFDGALTHFTASKFDATKVQAILNTEQTRQQIRLDIEQAYYNFNKLLVQLQAREIRLAQVKNDLALAKQNLEIGNISKVELSTALTAWEQEHLAWLAQRVSAEKSYRDLLFACGYPADLR